MSEFNLYPHIDIIKEYDVYRRGDPKDHDVLVKGIPYIFITTPKLNLDKLNTRRDSFLMYLETLEPDLFNALTTNGKTVSPFIKILTNAFRGMDGKDLAARTIDVGETFYGYKQTLPISLVDSLVGDTTTVKFEEYKSLPIIKLHKAWVEYTENVRRGTFSPSKDAIKKRYLDYVSSIYYFLLDFDGETILYFSKYTGAVPISVPYANLATDGKEHDIPEISVEYSYSFKEDLDPAILMDFNKVATLDSEALRYSTEGSNKGVIPYTTNDLLPYNFTESNVKATKVLVVKTDPYENDSLHPKTSFKLKFFK
ncbi:hypothetical protein Goe21_02310 [Bacillus phage vB_BsuM-Goe21]|nr:hypothetical protein Goe21_02310 [Bacillus phage vB_BsuM-Goe21]